jgi:hypothetical protein
VANKIFAAVHDNMDAREGRGTGQMAIRLREVAKYWVASLQPDWIDGSLSSDDVTALIKKSLGTCATEMGYCSRDGRYEIPVHNYQAAIDRANKRLKWANLGDSIVIVQSPEAKLLEAFYQYTLPTFMTEKKLLDPQEFIGLSKSLVGVADSGAVAVPFVGWDDADTARVFKTVEARFEQLGHAVKFKSSVSKVEDVPLPRDDEPLPPHKARNDKVKKIRYGLFPAMASLGVAAGSFPKGMVWSGLAQMAAWTGLEVQFAKLSGKFWNKIWYRYGFTALTAVNFIAPFAVALLASSVALVTGEIDYKNIAGGIAGDSNLLLFGKAAAEAAKRNITWTLGLFLSSFAAMQVIMSKEKAFGETSEGKRLVFESVTGSGPQLARGILAASSFLVSQMAMVNVLGMNMRIDDFVGYSIQVAFALLISAPLGFKIWKGDELFDRETARSFSHPIQKELPQSLGARFRSICSRGLSALYRGYTFSRQ